MSKSSVGISVGIAAVVLATTLLSSAAEARRGIGGPLGVMRFAAARMLSLGGLGRVYHHRARHYRPVQTAALRSQDIRIANNPGSQLGNATARGQITAAAAMAGWEGWRSARSWGETGSGTEGQVGS